MNIESSKTRFEELVLPSTESSILLLQKINAQIVEFNRQGTLAAIGCKYGIVLILDMLAKEVVRYFNLYSEKQDWASQFEANINVDQFGSYRKINYAYAEDDFVYQQKQAPQMQSMQNLDSQKGPKDSKAPLSGQIGEQKAAIEFFKIEPKDKLNSKAQISFLDWSVDGRFVCATFKVENVAVVWNIFTCEKVFEFNAQQQSFGNLNKAIFYNLNPNILQVSGDKAVIIDMQTKQQVTVSEQGQASTAVTSNTNEKATKRKGSSVKQSTFLLQSIINGGNRYYVLIDNQSKLIFLLKDKTEQTKFKQDVNQFFNVTQTGVSKSKVAGDEEMKDESNQIQEQEFEMQSVLDTVT